jgi:hypothetical protein
MAIEENDNNQVKLHLFGKAVPIFSNRFPHPDAGLRGDLKIENSRHCTQMHKFHVFSTELRYIAINP